MSFRSKITIKKWHNFFSIFSFCVKTRQRGRNYAKYRIIFYGISSSSCWICLWFMLRFYCEAEHIWSTNQGAIVRWWGLLGGRCFRFNYWQYTIKKIDILNFSFSQTSTRIYIYIWRYLIWYIYLIWRFLVQKFAYTFFINLITLLGDFRSIYVACA